MLVDRRILVTGAGGFLGSHVVEGLLGAGCARPRIATPASRDVDLTDRAAVRQLFETHRPEIVLHLAARVGGIGANQRSPGTFFRDNMLMGVHVLDEAVRAGVSKVVLVGTVCSYPKFTPVPFKEAHLFDGYPEETNAAYGIAKRALFAMAAAYRQEHGLRTVALLPTNLYGPRDHFDLENSHVIPAMIRKMVDAHRRGDEPVPLWGDGSPTRDFLFVEDAARAIIHAAEACEDPGPLNLGSGVEVSMRELAGRIQAAVGHRGDLRWDPSRPNGQPRRVLDSSRARELLGFAPVVSLEDGLRRTVRWYLDHEQAILVAEQGRSR